MMGGASCWVAAGDCRTVSQEFYWQSGGRRRREGSLAELLPLASLGLILLSHRGGVVHPLSSVGEIRR